MRAKVSFFLVNGVRLDTTIQSWQGLPNLWAEIKTAGEFVNDELVIKGELIMAVYVLERLGEVDMRGKQ